MRAYLDLLAKIMDKGADVQSGAFLPKEGRKPMTKKLFGEQLCFDLADGFPAVTTKPLAWKWVVLEWIWFMTGTGRIDLLRKHGVTIWDAWVKKDAQGNDTGDLGRVYGVQFRHWRDVQPIEPVRHTPQPAPSGLFFPLIEPDANSTGDELLGRTFTATNPAYGDYVVIKAHGEDDGHGHLYYDIQFLATGYVAERRLKRATMIGDVKDRYAATVCGVGRLGGKLVSLSNDDSIGDVEANVEQTWRNMIKRCYDPSYPSYDKYGGRGVVVDGAWHVFSTFHRDVRELDGWEAKLAALDAYQLDKDMLGGDCYAKETCVWASGVDQHGHTSSATPFQATSPDGVVYKAVNAASFARTFGLDRSAVTKCVRGEQVQTKGWTFSPLASAGMIYREREIDQIAQARDDIRAVIANPFDRARRRIIVTLWNPPDIPSMALPPCHSFHFYDMVPPGSLDKAPCDTFEDFEAWRKDTLDGRWGLNLHLCARSIDAVKGLPFNIASYALMLSVMARVTGCKPGKLLITFNDVHIYDNQFDDVREQLTREPYKLPTLGVATDGPDGFDDICKDLTIAEAHNLDPRMFQLVGYKSHPKLKSESEVAV